MATSLRYQSFTPTSLANKLANSFAIDVRRIATLETIFRNALTGHCGGEYSIRFNFSDCEYIDMIECVRKCAQLYRDQIPYTPEKCDPKPFALASYTDAKRLHQDRELYSELYAKRMDPANWEYLSFVIMYAFHGIDTELISDLRNYTEVRTLLDQIIDAYCEQTGTKRSPPCAIFSHYARNPLQLARDEFANTEAYELAVKLAKEFRVADEIDPYLMRGFYCAIAGTSGIEFFLSRCNIFGNYNDILMRVEKLIQQYQKKRSVEFELLLRP